MSPSAQSSTGRKRGRTKPWPQRATNKQPSESQKLTHNTHIFQRKAVHHSAISAGSNFIPSIISDFVALSSRLLVVSSFVYKCALKTRMQIVSNQMLSRMWMPLPLISNRFNHDSLLWCKLNSIGCFKNKLHLNFLFQQDIHQHRKQNTQVRQFSWGIFKKIHNIIEVK